MTNPIKQNLRLILLLVPLVLIGLGFSIYKFQTDPKRAFADMLRNNLTTESVTKTLQSSKTDSSSRQRISTQSGGQTYSRWYTTVTKGKSLVTTDSIGLKTADYVRYTQITDKDGKNAYPTAVNVWATTASSSSATAANLLSTSLLDLTLAPVPPLGNVTKSTRDDMLGYIQTQAIFQADFNRVKTVTVDGRKAYEYPVSVKLAPYVRLMQSFAHAYGLTDLDDLSASQYQSAAPIKINLTVDTLSHQMLRLSFPATGFSETFTDYGITRPLHIPTTTISGDELQKRFSAGE